MHGSENHGILTRDLIHQYKVPYIPNLVHKIFFYLDKLFLYRDAENILQNDKVLST